MSIANVTAKCWILALFIRDDGERFLLGDGAYDFKDSQQHFSANEMVNDVVDVQGDDGVLLAGQVRRSGTQVFEGYIGGGTTSKTAVEDYRQDFIAFFAKNHFYKVVYVLPDGSAVQRQRGFIVDAPEVKELWQQSPEYHVALNFEDVNYYVYDENAEGEEIYGELANIIISGANGGGVVWEEGSMSGLTLYGDTKQTTYSGKNLCPGVNQGYYISAAATAYGKSSSDVGLIIPVAQNTNYSVSTTAVQTRFRVGVGDVNIQSGDDTTKALYSGRNLDGTANSVTLNTGSHTYLIVNATTLSAVQIEVGSAPTSFEPYVGGVPSPSPDYPQDVNVATGNQTVTVGGQSLPLNLGTTELCKVGDYQDSIYKVGADWYLHKATGKTVLNGSEGFQVWSVTGTTTYKRFALDMSSVIKAPADNETVGDILSDYLSPVTGTQTYNSVPGVSIMSTGFVAIYDTRYNTEALLPSFKTWLSSTQPSLYYALANPTDTQITDATLVSQLNAIQAAGKPSSASATSPNLPVIISVDVSGGLVWDEVGLVWEAGVGSGTNNIFVDSVASVSPIWEVSGPITDPTIEILSTGTTLTYEGTLAEGQTLVVNSNDMTALLNGTNVLSSISGDWLRLAPGDNRVVFTATQAGATSSTLLWQKVVG